MSNSGKARVLFNDAVHMVRRVTLLKARCLCLNELALLQ